MLSNTEVISVQGLTKAFSSNMVLKGISFTVHKGEVVGIIGPSGSGKSTILRCITGLERVDCGSIYIEGTAMVENGVYASPMELRSIALKVGLVFQNFNLFPHLSVIQNIVAPQVLVLKTPKAQAIQIAQDLLSRVDLSSKAASYPYELSGGQKQRVSIARALALHPQVLLFDEPTSALDPELTGEILEVIKALARENMTMVIVTHEMAFARDTSDRIIFVDKGSIVEEGESSSLIEHPEQERTKAFLARFKAH